LDRALWRGALLATSQGNLYRDAVVWLVCVAAPAPTELPLGETLRRA
jgi:hypothetical protein